MPFELPDLDTPSYEELLRELLAAAQRSNGVWTDFNEADPGRTLLELLAWVGDNLLYETNQIGPESYLNFTRMLAGGARLELERLAAYFAKANPTDEAYREFLSYAAQLEKDSPAGDNAARISAHAIDFWRTRYRAVTAPDIRDLVVQAGSNANNCPDSTVHSIVESRDDLVEIILVADRFAFTIHDYKRSIAAQASETITYTLGEDPERRDKQPDAVRTLKYMRKFLNARKPMGTMQTVNWPVFTPIKLDVKLTLIPQANFETLADSVAAKIIEYLSPLKSGGNETLARYNGILREGRLETLLSDASTIQNSSVSATFAKGGAHDERTLSAKGFFLLKALKLSAVTGTSEGMPRV